MKSASTPESDQCGVGQESAAAPDRSLLARWGRWAARRWWVVLAGWLVALAASAMLYPHFQDRQTAVSYRVSGSDSDQVATTLKKEFPRLGTESDVLVFDSDTMTVEDPAYQRAIADSVRALSKRSEVGRIAPPTRQTRRQQVSADGRTALALVTMTGKARHLQDLAPRLQRDLNRDAQRASGGAVDAYLVGYAPTADAVITTEAESAEQAESLGVPAALLVLLLATGAGIAAVLPLGLAACGVVLAFGALGGVSYATSVDGLLSTVVPMIGLGVGIDYALFTVSRFREELAKRRRGRERPDRSAVYDSVAIAMGRSGKTILLSGIVVMVCMLTLTVLHAATFRQLGLGMSLSVACALLSSLTLLPAMLGLLKHRVEWIPMPWRRRVIGARASGGRGPIGRLAHGIMRAPIPVTVVTVVALLIVAVPLLNLRLGIDLGISALSDKPAGKGQQILSDKFTPGALMPVDVIYRSADGKLDAKDLATLYRLRQAIAHDHDVSQVTTAVDTLDAGASPTRRVAQLRSAAMVSSDQRSAYLSVVPSVSPDSRAAMDLVGRLRGSITDRAVPGSTAQVTVGGPTAEFVDISTETKDKLWLVIGLVLVLSFLFLMTAFRSLLLPVKAIIMNLLATGATYGMVVWIFQEGHLEGALDFQAQGIIQAYLPLVTFALLFGLSMDYEVFLVRRIQESWKRSGNNTHAVAEGLEHTALPITAAALIMVVVFGSFVTAEVLELKQLGFALALAILVDATLIRLLLVPAVMRLAGRANWWLPRWLDRLLPRLDID